jgi:hypothetical protein
MIASLMERQHRWVQQTPENNAMLAVNLRAGFIVSGTCKRRGQRVLFAKCLNTPAPTAREAG